MVSSLTKPQVLYQPFALTGDRNAILDAPDAENPQLANIQTGFPAITQTPIDNGGIPPERKDFNGLGFLLSSFYYFVQCGGAYTFEQDVSDAIGGYPLGAILYYTDGNGVTYRVKSNKANNEDNFVSTPAYIGDSWDIVSDTPQDLMPYIGDVKTSTRSANHGNWFLCDGQAISRTTYATLFSIIGTNFGAGDGVTTFNLPDYRGKFLRGLGGDSAADIYTTQAEGLPNITGSATGAGGTGYISTTTGVFVATATASPFSGTSIGAANAVLTFDASRSSALYGASSHVTPVNQAINYFIKVL